MEDQRGSTLTAPIFAIDWRGKYHRPLSDSARDEVIKYIDAICRRQDKGDGPLLADARRVSLWRAFRTAYDSLDGPRRRSDREDALKAMEMI